MRRHLSAGLLAAFAAPYAVPAAAGPDFGYVEHAEIEEPHETEVTLWATDRRGKGEGHYDAQDYKLEVEHGFTERLQASAYINLASHHVRGLDGEFERVDRNLGFQGVEMELKYQLSNPETHPFGFAFYVEPGWERISKVTGHETRELEIELKAIVQKNLVPDRLVWAANLTLEPEWEREREEIAPGVAERSTEKEMALEVSSGLSYRLAPKWWVGAEARYHSVYPDWVHGLHRENYAVYAGPSVHYDGGEWSVTATWQPQLFGGPNERGSSLELEDHEKRELRLKISHEF